MNFRSCEKQIFKSFGSTKIDNLFSENVDISEMSLTF